MRAFKACMLYYFLVIKRSPSYDNISCNMKSTTKPSKSKKVKDCSGGENLSTENLSTYAAIKEKYSDDLLSPTFRIHLVWGEGHLIGLGKNAKYFRSSYSNIKCPYCSSHFSANKERIRHTEFKHPRSYNETTEEFDKSVRQIDVSKLSPETRKNLKSIIIQPESYESPVSPIPRVVSHNLKVAKHTTKVTKRKPNKKKISPNSLSVNQCSVSSSSPDGRDLASFAPRPSVIMLSGNSAKSSQLSVNSEQEVVAVPEFGSPAPLAQPLQSLMSPLQEQELSDSLAPYRRQLQVIYNESFIPTDLTSCQVLLKELIHNHLNVSQLALFPVIAAGVARKSL